MWPWEHLAVGYLCYSLGSRVLTGDPPAERDVLLLGIATQLPDLIDKPLSWGLQVFPTGYALGHSVFLAIPLGLVLLGEGIRRREPTAGLALLVGYWSHLAGDVVSPLRNGDPLAVGRLLWPLVEGNPYSRDLGLERALVYLARLPAELSTMDPFGAVLFYLLLPALTALLWLADGAPGVSLLFRRVRTSR
jgi:hypothetical protein